MAPGKSEPDSFGWRWLVVLALAALALIALERAFSILSRPAPQAPFAGDAQPAQPDAREPPPANPDAT